MVMLRTLIEIVSTYNKSIYKNEHIKFIKEIFKHANNSHSNLKENIRMQIYIMETFTSIRFKL